MIALFLLLSLNAFAHKGATTLHHKSKVFTEVKEPSDIIPDQQGGFMVVSDNGRIFRTDKQGKKTEKSECDGMDFEAITTDHTFYYVSDERSHTIKKLDMKTLQCISTIELQVETSSNDGLETFFYDEDTKEFVGISEKSPVVAYTFNQQFEKTKATPLSMASDISSGCYHKGFYYLLSDEDHRVFQCNKDFSVINSWSVKIINPEGICFDTNGDLVICSDEMQTIFFYDSPENK